MYEFYTKVVGVTFEGRQRNIRNLREGDTLILQRDPFNNYDRNAIKVLNPQGEQIGFLSRDVASTLAFRMDSGYKYTAICTAITGLNPGENTGVNIKIVAI